jgi:hypothetical protein
MRTFLMPVLAALASVAAADGVLPRVWMSYRQGADEKADCLDMKAHGVDVVQFGCSGVAACRRHLEAIRAAGGIAVLAHPRIEYFQSLKKMVDLGLNGIEISHPSITEEAAKEAVYSARKYGLYCSGGTDHTGVLSSFGGKQVRPVRCGISKEEYEILKSRALRRD